MAELWRAIQEAVEVVPFEDYTVVGADDFRVLLEVNEWDVETSRHISCQLKLRPKEARLLSEMLAAHASRAEIRMDL